MKKLTLAVSFAGIILAASPLLAATSGAKTSQEPAKIGSVSAPKADTKQTHIEKLRSELQALKVKFEKKVHEERAKLEKMEAKYRKQIEERKSKIDAMEKSQNAVIEKRQHKIDAMEQKAQ